MILLLCCHFLSLQQVLNINTDTQLNVSTKDYAGLKNHTQRITYSVILYKFFDIGKIIEMENRLMVTSG